jgi:thioredoxin 1
MAVLKVNDSEFKAALQAHDKVVVKYYADWCGNCRLFSPKFNRMAEDEKNAGIAFLDVNAEESPEARKLAGVSNLPFFAVFSKGQLVKGDFTSKQESVEGMIDLIRG